jgi:DNA-3-methyladenine glycosylase
MKLPQTFYSRTDVVQIAQELIGKYLMTNIDGELCGGMIVETEAYCGATDKACHAHLNRRTKRTEVMFQTGGVAYIYLCYGIHHLFNVVTNQQNHADAVLIRAIEPADNIETMLKRRKQQKADFKLTAGPGALTEALGISTKLYGTDLQGDMIWIEDRNIQINPTEIIAGYRVGVSYAREDALLPWRFSLQGSKWVSRAKPKY